MATLVSIRERLRYLLQNFSLLQLNTKLLLRKNRVLSQKDLEYTRICENRSHTVQL